MTQLSHQGQSPRPVRSDPEDVFLLPTSPSKNPVGGHVQLQEAEKRVVTCWVDL